MGAFTLVLPIRQSNLHIPVIINAPKIILVISFWL